MMWRFTLSRRLYVKCAHGSADTEAATMSFIRARTSIPVPRVWCVFRWRGRSYIIMTRAPGAQLQYVWRILSPDTREHIVAQLRQYVDDLRTLPVPRGSLIGFIHGGPVYDCRLHEDDVSGPFSDENALNLQLRHGGRLEIFSDQIKAAHSISHEIVFTHGDLAPRNIMVYDSTITAVLDWECAGWFPAHWEYLKARFGSFGMFGELWDPWIPKCVPVYELEWRADSEMVQASIPRD